MDELEVSGLGRDWTEYKDKSIFDSVYLRGYREGYVGRPYSNNHRMLANNQIYLLGWIDGKGDYMLGVQEERW